MVRKGGVLTANATRMVPLDPGTGRLVRSLLAWPGTLFDVGTKWDAPDVSPVERHRRLTLREPPPEGWLALQPGLATVGDANEWTSFVARGATALAVGGIHGEDRPSAFRRFREETAVLGLRRQAVYPVREPDLEAAQKAGFESLPVGVEAWVHLDRFTLRGKRFADLRQMRNRATKRGVHIEEVDAQSWQVPLADCWRRFLEGRRVPWQVRWLSGRPVFERPFGRRTFVAHRDGEVQAFCTVLPGPSGRNSFDVLCRDPQAIPGAMETLLVETIRRLGDEGVAQVSLGPCPLAGDGVRAVPGWRGRAMRWAYEGALAERWFGFQRLAAFKEKFRPKMEVVHLGLAPRWSMVAWYLTVRIWALGG
ncbi:MAG: DUF2156 domain-containing protein [Myxococcota bacterium]